MLSLLPSVSQGFFFFFEIQNYTKKQKRRVKKTDLIAIDIFGISA